MSFTDTFETRVLTWVFTASSVTRPTAWFVGLYTATPNDTGGGTEVSGGGYVRKAATFTISGDTASNSGAIEYPTATGNYGTVSHVGIFDASSGGNLIAYAALSVSKTISTGDVLRIPAGDLDVTLS